MFTWNFQYISKARLAATLGQLGIAHQREDVLIRIHTAIHYRDEAVELAKFIKEQVPNAVIFGTSTSAVISKGKLLQNQCIISVSQMSGSGRIRSAFISTYDSETGLYTDPNILCRKLKKDIVEDDTKLMLTFLTESYRDVYTFVDKCNDYLPGVQMIGGIACKQDENISREGGVGFVFNENEWSDKAMILATISGENFECMTSYATGVQDLGQEREITDSFATCILSIEDEDAAAKYRMEIGDDLKKKPAMTKLFPFVYADAPELPIYVGYSEERSLEDAYDKSMPCYERYYNFHPNLDTSSKRELINANHNVEKGRKLKRAFIYDRKIISDNGTLFRKVENFEKAETIFAYSCVDRSVIYSNCVKWELSAYENSNICGCLTEGEIAYSNGRNTYSNCTFILSVMGEEAATQECNPYAFSHTDSLAADNRELLGYLMEIEGKYERYESSDAAEGLKAFVQDCELKLLYSENEDIPNEAAMNMDISLKGYDRVCMINVSGTTSMRVVFPPHLIDLTYRHYIMSCQSFAKENNYRFYRINKWQVAIGAPSYMVSLADFALKMEKLQKKLFEASDEFIAIVPTFCVINDCNIDNIYSVYNSARLNMMNRNIQFYVCDASAKRIDEEQIREQYHMVNVINYAIAHDKIIPYFQGINDNTSNRIHHYEALMRLEDENGKVYLPGIFLDVARNFGLLYDSISLTMIKKVFEIFKSSEERSVSINLGMRDIRNRELTEYIYAFLATAKHPENFIFEILENEDIGDYNLLMGFVDRVHALGGLISIDDFGSGYSNLQHILSIHSDYLKIDGSIIRTICQSMESENLVALISGWKNLSSKKVKIVAEFVENEDIQKLLMKYAIDFSQGYLFAKPAPDVEL